MVDPTSIHHAGKPANFDTAEDSRFVAHRYSNVKSDLIEITEDKLENILLKHLSSLAIRKSWITPLTLFLAVLLANLTATFSNKFGIDAPVWQAFFLLLAITSFLWFVLACLRAISRWRDGSLSSLFAIIKAEQVQHLQLFPNDT